MLLRSSRAATALTKEASIAGRVGKGVLGHFKKRWKGYLGTGLVGAAAAPAIAQGVQKGRLGTHPQYIQAQQMGMAPRLTPGTPIPQ